MIAGHADPDPIPRMLGRYHVLEALGDSPLGVLHLARLEGPQHFQRWAVVLRLHPELCARGALVDAFYDAARITARLQHPNVAAAYDVGEPGEPPWAAYEYVHGESAEELLSRAVATGKCVPWDIACRVVSDAAAGTEAIHEVLRSNPGARSLLQGPLAPASIVIGYDGKTKIVDGCLRAFDPIALPYTAPEAVGSPADERADVFALGVLLWELVAGKRLFAGATEEETRGLLSAHHVPSLKAMVRCPSKLDEIVACAIAPDPGARYQTARSLARGLHAVVVAKGLVLTDDLVARYLYGLFRDRFEERQALLTAAANVTEVFRREDIEHLLKPPDTLRELPTQEVVLVEMGGPGTRRGGFEAPTRRGLDLIDDPTVPRKRNRGAESSQDLPTSPINDPAVLTSTAELPTAPRGNFSPRPDAPPFAAPAQAVPAPPPPQPEPPTVPRLPQSAQETVRPAPQVEDDSKLAIVVLGVAIAALTVLVVRLVQMKRVGLTPSPVASATSVTVPEPSSTPPLPSPSELASATTPVSTAPSPAPPVPTPTSTSTSTTASTPPPDSTSTAASPSASAATGAAAAPKSRSQTHHSSRTATRAASDDSSAETGFLTVICTPACDEVLDGSHSLGSSPVFHVTVSAGPHTLTLRTTDPPVEKSVAVVVSADETATVVKQSMVP